jgi:hypothetical protein
MLLEGVSGRGGQRLATHYKGFCPAKIREIMPLDPTYALTTAIR